MAVLGEDGPVIVPEVTLPAGIAWMADAPRCRPWLRSVPARVARAAVRWSLQVGEPFAGSHVSWTAPATTASGDAVVVKLQFPHDECEHEADALRRWDGNGAVQLLGCDAADHALLLERGQPETDLWDQPVDDALATIVGLVRQTTVAAGDSSITRLAEAATGWARQVPVQWAAAGRPFERRILDAVVDLLTDLRGSETTEAVLVNQDLHGGNVVRAERQPWLVIDPKPLVGDVAFAAASVVRSKGFGHNRAEVLRRLDAMVDGLGLDRDRAAGWAVAHAIAWSFDEGAVIEAHVDTARWLLDR